MLWKREKIKMVDSKTIVQSTKWSAVSEVLAKIASPLANIVLARLLAPDVFGLVASFTVVTTFAEVFTDAGFQKFIVQHEFKDDKELYDYTTVAFWTNMLFSIAIWLGIFIFRSPIASFIGSSGYGTEVATLSLLIPLHALSSIQNALYRRAFRFKELVPIRFVSSLMPLVVTIPCAVFFKNVWAIIIGNLAKEIVTAVMLTYNSLWKPTLFYKLAYLKNMFSDCLWLLGDSLMIWITSYASVFIVNRYLDPYHTGIFRTGVNTIQPYLNLIFVITSPVLFSALSRLQNNKNESNKIFLDYQKFASYIVVPMGVFVFIYRDMVTSILLGSAWKEAALLVGCSGLALPIVILIGQYNSVYFRAMGKAKIAMTVQGIYAIVMVALLLFAVRYQFKILSVVGGLYPLTYSVISILGLKFAFKFKISRVVRVLLPSIISSVVAALLSYAIMNFFSGAIWWQLICVAIACLVYLIVLMSIPQSRKAIVGTSAFKKIKKMIVK